MGSGVRYCKKLQVELHTKDFHDAIHVVHLSAPLHEWLHRPDRAFDGLRNLVDVLWLDNRFQVILEDFGKVI